MRSDGGNETEDEDAVSTPPRMTLPSPTRVAVGLSGGLDSSVVASLLVDKGYDVIGLTLNMFKDGSRCCSIDDIQRSQRICDLLENGLER